MSTAVHHCPFCSRFAWIIFFFYPSAPYLIRDFPWSIPSFFRIQVLSEQLPAFLTGYPLHFPQHPQVNWLESICYTWGKIHQYLFQQSWKKLLGRSCSYPTVSERILPFMVKITGYPRVWSFYWLTKILIMRPYLRFFCWRERRPHLIFSPVL